MGLFERMRVRGRAGGDAAAPGAQDALRLIGEGNALEDAGRHGDALQRYDDAIRLRARAGPRAPQSRQRTAGDGRCRGRGARLRDGAGA